ncbi:MAG TPA: DegT/DnrJ/EryC1/StrS family aminotransferase [Thermodesulfobacteriota bacterium]|nr:DegT/DnrJ/EryC1/StrS family aminotransferase [Thermodesulfobacteriota bacterium]
MRIPLLDLSRQYREIKKEVLREVQNVCDSQHYILGKNVSALEEEMAAYCGTRYAVGVASGSDAILLSLMAVGIGPGDKVITTPFTFFATAGSISLLGAVPVFADIHPETCNIDPLSIETLLKKSSRGTKAILPVHLYGQCADMGPIKTLARKHGLKVVEDAAQSIGARYRGRRAGSLGDAGCFSFYPTKNLGCFGDGGMVTTNNLATAQRLKMLRVHGSRKRYYYDTVGTNSRLDELQAAVLRVKLKYLDAWTERRITNARRYDRLLARAGLGEVVKLTRIEETNQSVYNQYVILVKYRDELREHLTSAGIGTEVYYPMPLHLQKCYASLGHRRGDFPVSEKVSRETLALPIFAELKTSEQEYVVSTIEKFYKRKSRR